MSIASSRLLVEVMHKSVPVYLDYNATTPLSTSVIAVIQDALVNAWGNPSSNYAEGWFGFIVSCLALVLLCSHVLVCWWLNFIFFNGSRSGIPVCIFFHVLYFSYHCSVVLNNKLTSLDVVNVMAWQCHAILCAIQILHDILLLILQYKFFVT